jgi:quercetin dioxygenase-like cupin family protein
LTRPDQAPSDELAPGVGLRLLATGSLGANGLTTALVTFEVGAELPYHTHPFSEAIVVLEGRAEVLVEGRSHLLEPFDAIHIPSGTAHATRSASADRPAVLHSSFASETPTRQLVSTQFARTDGGGEEDSWPERHVRFRIAPAYELAPHALFRDLFSSRIGSRGICGGYGRFDPGSSLPCHVHEFDESITIVAGTAVCQVAGREYQVANYDTVCVPRGVPHRFLNRSDQPMAMIWVYAGDEPGRTLVDQSCCQGTEPSSSIIDS